MKYRILLMGLLSGGLLVSCQSDKAGGGGGALADNGGYSDGGFYGDSSDPAPQGYPRDGESFATSGGAPFGHNEPAGFVEPVEPVSMPVATPRPPAPRPAATSRVAASRPSAVDPYDEAYADGSAYAGDHGSERAVVTPYVERSEPVEVATTSPKKTSTASKGTAKKAVVSAPKKKSPVVASTRSGGTGASKAGGKKSGTTVKAVYTPSGKGKTSAKKKATVARVHSVKRGDTLSALSSRYGVTVAELKKRNKLTTDTIVVGKRLTID